MLHECGMRFSHNVIFTGRNEVVVKVMFLHVSVILSTGGSPGRETPLPGRTLPQDQADPPPLDQADHAPPQTRQTPPRTRQTPPWTRQTPPGPGRPPQPGRSPRTRQTPPPGKQTPEYGLRAADTHPTGMHSCLCRKSPVNVQNG